MCLIFVVRRKRQSVAEAQSKAIVSSYPSNGNPSSNEFRSSQGYTTSPSTYLSPSIPSYPSSKSDFENSANYLGVPLFSYNELEEATENFHERRELGDGGFGTVYCGMIFTHFHSWSYTSLLFIISICLVHVADYISLKLIL